MKKIVIFFAVLSGLLLTASCYVRIDESKIIEKGYDGTRSMRTDSLPAFKGIQLNGSMDVLYHPTKGAPRAEVWAPDPMLPRMKCEVDDAGILQIYLEDTGFSVFQGELFVEVYGGELESAHVKGSGDMEIECLTGDLLQASVAGSGDLRVMKLSGNRVDASLAGSGDMSLFGIACQDLSVRVAGSGDVTVKGKAAKASLAVSGSGDIHAGQLSCENVSQSVSGSGDIER